MKLSIIFGAAVVVALVWLVARPKSRHPRRRSGRPRLWDRTPGTESAAWFGLWGGGDSSSSHHDSEHSYHDGGNDGGHHSSTNAPSDGGSFDGDGGGGDGGEH